MNKLPLAKLNRLIDDGYSLITIGEKKKPNFKWKECQTKALTKEQFSINYNAPSTLGQGYCTGYNNIEVIDIDLKIYDSLAKQQEIWAEYLQLLKDHISDFDKKFVIYKTISNGYHIIYKCKKIAGNVKIATPKGYTQALIESRGMGGYCFIYDNQISPLGYSDVVEISVEDRDFLWGLSKLYNYNSHDEVEQPQEVKKQYTSKKTPWADYNDRHDVFFVAHDDFKIVRKMSDKTLILRHGSDAAHSGYVFDNSGIMYLFTTGTIYPNEKALRAFDLYCYKYHSGDYKEAAKQLYKEGYGDRIVKQPDSISVEPPLMHAEFPIDIYPPNIRNYMAQCNKTLNSSIDFMGVSMLWNLSVIIGNSMRVVIKNGWVETGVLWIALVGRAGIGKTPSINNIIFPLERANNTEIKNFNRNYDRYKEYAELTKKEQRDVEVVHKPRRTQFIANDVTLEALVEMHAENKNAVGVFKDELAGWLKDIMWRLQRGSKTTLQRRLWR